MFHSTSCQHFPGIVHSGDEMAVKTIAVSSSQKFCARPFCDTLLLVRHEQCSSRLLKCWLCESWSISISAVSTSFPHNLISSSSLSHTPLIFFCRCTIPIRHVTMILVKWNLPRLLGQ